MLKYSSVRAVGGRLQLRSYEVHLWLARPLDCRAALLQNLEALSADEAERAQRFHFLQDRNRYIARRGILRQILSYYQNCPPSEVDFTYQAWGKPQLAHSTSLAGDLRFNLSHSGDAALYAITSGRDIGVDIELIRPEVEWADIASSFFAWGEIAELRRLSSHSRTRGFFNCWTRKEAYLKARGDGLSIALDTFEVSLAPGDAPALLRASDVSELKRWSVWDVLLTGDLVGAFVVEGKPSRFRFFFTGDGTSADRRRISCGPTDLRGRSDIVSGDTTGGSRQ